MKILFIIFVICMLAVIGVALGLWRYLRIHIHRPKQATAPEQAHEGVFLRERDNVQNR
jgi:hypothetical protein